MKRIYLKIYIYLQGSDSTPKDQDLKPLKIKDGGKRIASLLVSHGANLEYRDRALRYANIRF